MSVRTFAAVDIGSFELSMKIFEFRDKNQMREVEHLSRRIELGSDTYASGKISNEKLDELCSSLREFSGIMKAYKVESYRAYATSAVRETKNRVIVQDMIEQRTGIKVEILGNSEQRFLNYKSIASKGESFKNIIEEKTAIVDIGGGSIQLSLFDNDTLVSTQNLRLGVLRIQELLNHMEARTGRVEELIEEIVSAQLATYKKLYLKDREIKNIIIVDDYISQWAIKTVGGDMNRTLFDRDEFDALTKKLKGNVTGQAASLDVSQEKLPLIVISAVMVKLIANLMGASYIWTPGATLCDGIAYEYAENNNLLKGEHDFEKDITACAVNISKRYMGSRRRAETLEKITMTIFDSMKKVHGLGKRERLYLQIAAILHDCGKYISLTNIGEPSYNIIMSTEIIGLSHMEREIVASVVRFNHSPFSYYGEQSSESGLDRESYLVVAKLTAILRLANSLDRSHKQKFKGVKAALRDNELILTVDTREDTSLEKRAFELNEKFFMEVYSIKPVLKQKKSL